MKFIKLTSSFIAFSLGISAFAGESIKVGITSGPSQQVLEVAKKNLRKKNMILILKLFHLPTIRFQMKL